MRKSLRAQLIFFFVALAITPLLLVGAVTIRRTFAVEQAQAIVLQQEIVRRVATEVESFIFAREAELRLLIDIQGFSSLEPEEQRTLMRNLLRKQDFFAELILIDKDGQATIYESTTTISAAVPVASYLNQPLFGSPKATGGVYYSSVQVSADTGEPFMSIALPLSDVRSGEFVGVLAANVRFRPMWVLMANVSNDINGLVYVTDNNGRVVAHPNPSVVLQNTIATLPDTDGFTTGLEGESVILARKHISLGLSVLLRPQGFNVAAEVPTSQALALANRAIISTITAVLLAALSASIIGAYAALRITRPITVLAQTATAISGGDLSQQVPVTQQNEIGDLGTAFNSMTQQLRNLVGGLEQRVANRTKDLNLAAEIGRQVSRVRGLEPLLTQAANLIQEQFNLYQTQIYLTDEAGENLILRASVGHAGTHLLDAGHELPINRSSLNGTAATEKQPIIVADTRSHPMFLPHPLLPNTRAEMVVPLIVSDRVVGVLDLQSSDAEALTDENLPAFTILAGQMAIAIQNEQQNQVTQQALQDTQRSRQFLNSLLESIPNPIFYKDAQGIYLGFNQAFLDYLGQPDAALRGKSVFDLQTDQELAQKYHDMDVALLENPAEPQVYEASVTYADGSLHTVIFNKSAFHNPDGAVGGLVGTIVDITERKQMETALREEQLRTQTILQAVTIPLLISRASDDKIHYVNEYLAATVQTPVAELMSQGTPNFYVDTADRTAVIGQIQREGFVNNYELRLQRADGDIFWALLSARLINFDGEPAIITSLIDITDRKTAEAMSAKQAADLQTVAELSAQVTAIQDPQQLLQEIVQETQRRLDLYHCHVFLLDETGENLQIHACGWHEGAAQYGTHGDAIIPLHTEQSLVAQAARTRKAVVVNDVYNDSRWLPNELLPDTRAEVAVPLLVGDQVLGVLDTQATTVDRFTEQDVRIQMTLAAQIAVALQNARQFAYTQQALEDAKTFRQLVAASGQGIGIADLQGVVTYSNPALLKMIGVEKLEEFAGQMMFPLYPPEIQQRFLDEIIPTVLQQGSWQGELQFMTNGRTTPTYEDYFLLRDEAGNPAQFAAIISDITERKQAEETLRQNEATLQTMIENAPEAVIVVDVDRGVFAEPLNENAVKLYGLPRAQLVQVEPAEMSPPVQPDGRPSSEAAMSYITEALTGGTPVFEWLHRNAQGQDIPCEVRLVRLPAAGRNLVRASVTDISERQAAQAAQARLQRELEEQLERANALQRAMTREGWRAFLTASERPVQGFMFANETMQPIMAGPLNEQIATNAPFQLEDITEPSFNQEHTAVSIPLNLHGESIGVIGARSATGDPLSQEQEMLLTALSEQVTDALERARLFEETEIGRQQIDQRAQELAAINEVAQSVSQQLDPEQLLQTIYVQTKRILPVDAFIVAQYNPNTNIVSYPLVYDNEQRYDETPGPLRENSLIAQVLQNGVPTILNRTPEEVNAFLEQRQAQGAALGNTLKISASILYVPLQIGQQIAGALSIQSYQHNVYGQREANLLTGIANHLAIALENARLFAEAQSRAEQMALINQLAETVAQQLDPTQVLETVYQQVQEVIPTDAFIVGLWDAQSDLVHYPVVYDQGERFAEADTPPVPGSYMEQILRTGQPILVNYTPEEIAHREQEPFVVVGAQKHPSSLMFVPLYSGLKTIGAISLQNYRGHQYTLSDLQLLGGIANHVAVALENARLFTQIQRRAERETMVNRITQKIQSTLTIENALETAVTELAHIFQSPYAAAKIELSGHNGDHLSPQVNKE
ncbi:MAG: GAF domain-containing protein [Anaerolinea sp.]|nr:GAF domain-containing protein [Anaerolinea sp.]